LDDARARDQKLLATIGRAECLAGLARPDEGIALATKVIDENDSKEKPVLFARAYNALGVCYLRAGKPEEALLAFLHVDLLFTQDPDAHAEALYHLTALWKALNHPERALQARSLLLDRYSGSPWTNKQEER
jgi:tetratricopeptide (TPR) repeat protein